MVALKIDPPLLNSACPWATTFEDIRDLYECPFTGAVTTRTSLVSNFSFVKGLCLGRVEGVGGEGNWEGNWEEWEDGWRVWLSQCFTWLFR
jgi:hypothetical protein